MENRFKQAKKDLMEMSDEEFLSEMGDVEKIKAHEEYLKEQNKDSFKFECYGWIIYVKYIPLGNNEYEVEDMDITKISDTYEVNDISEFITKDIISSTFNAALDLDDIDYKVSFKKRVLRYLDKFNIL